MHFEEREIKTYFEPLRVDEIEQGSVYFNASFEDWHMLNPFLEPYVFVGENLDPEVEAGLYFQDLESYRLGVRFETATGKDNVIFILDSKENPNLLEYERALDHLIWCSLRRRGVSVSGPTTTEARELTPFRQSPKSKS